MIAENLLVGSGFDLSIIGFFENLPRRFHYLLIGLLIGLIGGMGFLVVRHRMNAGHTARIIAPADPEASLVIRNFKHNAVKDGRKEWSLSAESASMYAKRNMVRLKKITAKFYMDGGQIITLNADEGKLHLDTDHIIASGHVTVEMPGYSLSTESLQYNHKTNIIQSDRRVTVVSPSGELTADGMLYHLNTKILICEGNVKGILHGAEMP